MHEIPEVDIEGAVQPNPIEPPLVDGPAALMIAPSAPEDGSAALITTPAIPVEDSVTLVTTPTVSADKLADSPPFQR